MSILARTTDTEAGPRAAESQKISLPEGKKQSSAFLYHRYIELIDSVNSALPDLSTAVVINALAKANIAHSDIKHDNDIESFGRTAEVSVDCVI
jgi:hypothetical protein